MSEPVNVLNKLSRKFLQYNLIGVQFQWFLLKTEYCVLQEHTVKIHV